MSDIATWLESLGLGRYGALFAEHDVDFDVLPELSEQDLEKLGMSLGHRKKLLKAIAALAVDEVESTTAIIPAPHLAEPSTPTQAERRQLTVMFVDLVGSTALSTRLDPEDLRELILAYQNAVADEIARFAGYIARYMGDGVLAYFGWPRAHEDEAERAVRAGLAVTAAVGRLSTPEGMALATRTGIATGLVVVGDLIGEGAAQEQAVVGETPNLAARLQGLARPDAVVISDTTHRLLAGRFECEDLGLHELKGFTELQQVREVLGPQAISSRFEAAHASSLLPLVDRLEVMELLLDRWSKVQHHEGQVVLILGEPGIGKSRVTQELRNRACAAPHLHIGYQCSPYHSNTALYPFIDQFGRAAEFEVGDSYAKRLDKLDRLLAMAVDDTREALPLIASLLSIPYSEPQAMAGMTAERRKERILDVLIEQFQGLAAKQPLLMTFEDVHWIDPTSLVLIERFVDRLREFPVLAVFAARPEFKMVWDRQRHISLLTLKRLDRNDSTVLVERVVGTKRMPAEAAQQIFERTDGIPLFLEEITKGLLESKYLEEREHAYVAASTLPATAIPATLQDSLMARLDQLADAKRVAQIGAAIGREFSITMLVALTRNQPGFEESRLETALQQLVDADLLIVRGTPPNAVYSFKHALIHDAAYDSLLKRQRGQIHSQIVSVLEGQFEETVETQPELLAHHCTEGRLYSRAVEYWLRAGKRAAERSANIEAAQHFQAGLAVLPGIPDESQRKRLELELRVALGAPLISTRGPGSQEVEQNYSLALELCKEVPESERHFKAHWGWWRVSMNHRIGRERADTLLGLARRLDDPGLLLQAHHCQWATLFHLGDHTACRKHVAAGLALYDPQTHRHQASVYGGHDARVCGFGERALSLWLGGCPHQATTELDKALAWAKVLGHVGSLAHARDYALILAVYRREIALVGELAEQMIQFAENEGLPDYLQRGLMYRGWATATSDDVDAGLELMNGALQKLQVLGTKEDLPMFLNLMAQVQHHRGDTGKAMECVQQGFAESAEAGLQFWLAELHRCKANLQLEHTEGAEIESEALQALNIAHEQGALALELRAAEDLAKLYRRQGKQDEACTLLAGVYGRYQDGLETPDLVRVRSLLDDLGWRC